MSLKKTLQNPFALVGQGFLVGAALFFATTPPGGDAPQPGQTVQPASAASTQHA